MTKGLNSIELFSGAGGLALGLERAGFHPLLLVDFFRDANETVRTNRPDWNVVTADIHDIADANIRNYYDSDKEIHLLAGGFPCQPFSYAGQRRGLEDTRGTVFFSLAKIISDLTPPVILLENVKGLLSQDKGATIITIKNVLYEIGYCLHVRVLNAWDYNVAQKRERLIIVGVKKEIQDVPFYWPNPILPRPILQTALANVPISNGQKYPPKKREVLDLVPPGGSWADLPKDIAKEYLGKSFFSGGGKRGMARRLSWDKPSLTLTCSPAQKQTERCHPDETRPLTIREYARIQSFPDDYCFRGSMSSQYKQIGNAVPVSLGEAIGKSIFEFIKRAKQ